MSHQRCAAAYCGCPTITRALNIACDVHWDILTERTRSRIRKWVLGNHPRGGGVRTIPEALFAVSSADGGRARRVWWDLLIQDVKDGMFSGYPDVEAAVHRHLHRASRIVAS